MKEVIYLEIEARDFKAVKHARLRLDRPGVCFVGGFNKINPRMGSNGAAKSTMLADALCWCLFGRTPGGLRNPDVKPWKGSAHTAVATALKADGFTHIVQREVHPKNRLSLDDIDISQERLESLIGTNFDLMTATGVLGQGRPLFFDLEPRKKMELFSETLGLERWDGYSENAKLCCDELDRLLTRLTRDRAGCKGQLGAVKETLVGAQRDSEAWAAAWRAATRAARGRLDALRVESEAVEGELAGAKLKLDSAQTEMDGCNRELDKLRPELLRAESRQLVIMQEVAAAEVKAETITAALDALKMAKECPVCGQSVKPANLDKHRAELKADLQLARKTIEAGVPPKLTESIGLLRQRVAHNESYAASFSASAQTASREVSKLTVRAAEVKAAADEVARTSKTDQINPHLKQITELQERERAITEELTALDQQVKEAEGLLECTRPWIKGYKDIKLQKVDETLQELTWTTNSMLEEIGLGDWQVEYVIEKETKAGTLKRELSVLITSPESGGPVRWEAWSFGEGQRLRLIGARALGDVLLNQIGLSMNLEVLDEPTKHLSDAGVEDVCAFLANRARREHKSIFYIDHQARDSVHFSSSVAMIRDAEGVHVRDSLEMAA